MAERILLADDSRLVRVAMSAALEHGGFEICGVVETADQAIELALRERPDLCLLDVYMPGSGIRAAEEICRQAPGTTVVMLSSSERNQDLLDSLRAGATGYLPKDIDRDRLRDTLRRALDGELMMPKSLVAKALREGAKWEGGRAVRLPSGRSAELTARQIEMIDMLADGRTTDEIAERLLIARGDMEQEIAELLATLEVRDTQAAVQRVTRAGAS